MARWRHPRPPPPHPPTSCARARARTHAHTHTHTHTHCLYTHILSLHTHSLYTDTHTHTVFSRSLLRSLGFSGMPPGRDPGPVLQLLSSRGEKTPTHPLLSLRSTGRKRSLCLAARVGKRSGDASEPGWKQRRRVHACLRRSVTQSFDGGRVCPSHTRRQRGRAGGGTSCLFPTSHVSLLPGLQGLKLAARSPGTVTKSATTHGRLITSLAQPNKWRLGEKIPEFEAVVTPKGARQRGGC